MEDGYDPERSEVKNLGIPGKYWYVFAVSHRRLVLLDEGNDTNYDSNVGDSK